MRKYLYIFLILIIFTAGMMSFVLTVEASESILNLNVETVDGERMVSLRELGNRLNWNLYFENPQKYVYINKSGKQVILKINPGEMNDSKTQISPQIYEGRTYIPVDSINMIIQELEQEAEKMLELLAYLSVDKNKCKPGEKIKAFIELNNISDKDVTLKYASGKLFDLYLFKDGKEVWCWSKGKYFTMALIKKELPAGEKLKYEVEVPISPEMKEGKYILTGEITTEEPLPLNKIEIEFRGSK